MSYRVDPAFPPTEYTVPRNSSSIEQIPKELLSQIFIQTDISSLYAATLVNREWYETLSQALDLKGVFSTVQQIRKINTWQKASQMIHRRMVQQAFYFPSHTGEENNSLKSEAQNFSTERRTVLKEVRATLDYLMENGYQTLFIQLLDRIKDPNERRWHIKHYHSILSAKGDLASAAKVKQLETPIFSLVIPPNLKDIVICSTPK